MVVVKTPPNRRREQADATRRRIVDAAYRLFSEGGYAAATMDAIAAQAGVAVQTVYHVFNTKAVLLGRSPRSPRPGSTSQRPSRPGSGSRSMRTTGVAGWR